MISTLLSSLSHSHSCIPVVTKGAGRKRRQFSNSPRSKHFNKGRSPLDNTRSSKKSQTYGAGTPSIKIHPISIIQRASTRTEHSGVLDHPGLTLSEPWHRRPRSLYLPLILQIPCTLPPNHQQLLKESACLGQRPI